MAEYLPRPIIVLIAALTDWWDALVPLMLINVAVAICIILIIPGPPAIFALYAITNELAHGHGVELRELLTFMRQRFVISWLWALPNIVFAFLAWTAFLVYGQFGTSSGMIMQWLVILVSALWITVQFYALPYYAELREKRLMQAWRNGLFTMLASPIYTLILMAVVAIITVISAVPVAPLFLGSLAVLALIGTRAVLERLETLGVRAREAALKKE